MSRKLNVLYIVIALITGGVVGYFISSMTVSRYNTVNATCSLINVAVDSHLLAPEQVINLGRLTKEKLGDSQAAQAFKLSDERIRAASAASHCSQFMVGMNLN